MAGIQLFLPHKHTIQAASSAIEPVVLPAPVTYPASPPPAQQPLHTEQVIDFSKSSPPTSPKTDSDGLEGIQELLDTSSLNDVETPEKNQFMPRRSRRRTRSVNVTAAALPVSPEKRRSSKRILHKRVVSADQTMEMPNTRASTKRQSHRRVASASVSRRQEKENQSQDEVMFD